ncbi:unnamed protein product, partial [Prunus brigantina]
IQLQVENVKCWIIIATSYHSLTWTQNPTTTKNSSASPYLIKTDFELTKLEKHQPQCKLGHHLKCSLSPPYCVNQNHPALPCWFWFWFREGSMLGSCFKSISAVLSKRVLQENRSSYGVPKIRCRFSQKNFFCNSCGCVF